MDLEQFRNLDMNNPGGWPKAVKAIALVLVFALAVAASWYFDWSNQLQRLEQAEAQERQLRDEFELKQRRAANLEAYEAQLAEMEESFGAMLRQLPSRAEVSRLLVDVSQTGLGSGLEFELFRPQDPVRREFYAELPVNIRVTGAYGEFATFVSGVANLPRIVTLHDIAIRRADQDEDDALVMELNARTYWYLDDEAEGGK